MEQTLTQIKNQPLEQKHVYEVWFHENNCDLLPLLEFQNKLSLKTQKNFASIYKKVGDCIILTIALTQQQADVLTKDQKVLWCSKK